MGVAGAFLSLAQFDAFLRRGVRPRLGVHRAGDLRAVAALARDRRGATLRVAGGGAVPPAGGRRAEPPYGVPPMLPFLLTVALMAVASRDTQAPAALLRHFRREERSRGRAWREQHARAAPVPPVTAVPRRSRQASPAALFPAFPPRRSRPWEGWPSPRREGRGERTAFAAIRPRAAGASCVHDRFRPPCQDSTDEHLPNPGYRRQGRGGPRHAEPRRRVRTGRGAGRRAPPATGARGSRRAGAVCPRELRTGFTLGLAVVFPALLRQAWEAGGRPAAFLGDPSGKGAGPPLRWSSRCPDRQSVSSGTVLSGYPAGSRRSGDRPEIRRWPSPWVKRERSRATPARPGGSAAAPTPGPNGTTRPGRSNR